MKKIVLFISLGRTDLQLLARRGEEIKRLPLGRDLRFFHQALLDGELPYHLDPQAVQYEEAPRSDAVDWRHDDFVLPDDYELELDEEGNLILVPAKLAPAIAALKEQNFKISAIVLFDTQRNQRVRANIYSGEPIATAQIIGEWLAQAFDLKLQLDEPVTEGSISRIHLLDGNMLNPGSGRDYPVNRQAIQRAEAAIRQAVFDEQTWAALSLGGGMPEFKEPIKSCAQFFFDQRVFLWQAPQYHPDDFQWLPPGKEVPSVIESYQLRRHIIHLIRQGGFIEAWGAAQSLDHDPHEQHWTRLIQAAAEHINGTLTLSQMTQLPPYFKQLKRSLSGPQPHALLVAFRVEASLRAGRLNEAIINTITFIETALIDSVKRHLPKGLYLVDSRQEIRGDEVVLDQLNQKLGGAVLRQKNQYAFGYTHIQHWAALFPSELKEALLQYKKAITTWFKKIRLIDLRHMTVHNGLDQNMMRQAPELFQRAGLWPENPQQAPLGQAFIGMPLTHQVLKALSVPDAANLYSHWVTGLINDLRSYQIK